MLTGEGVIYGRCNFPPEPNGQCDCRAEHVHQYFGSLHVLNDISIDIKRKEVLVIIGSLGFR